MRLAAVTLESERRNHERLPRLPRLGANVHVLGDDPLNRIPVALHLVGELFPPLVREDDRLPREPHTGIAVHPPRPQCRQQLSGGSLDDQRGGDLPVLRRHFRDPFVTEKRQLNLSVIDDFVVALFEGSGNRPSRRSLSWPTLSAFRSASCSAARTRSAASSRLVRQIAPSFD